MQRSLRLQKASRRFIVECLLDADSLGGASGPVETGRTGDDAVEVRRKALGLGHGWQRRRSSRSHENFGGLP